MFQNKRRRTLEAEHCIIQRLFDRLSRNLELQTDLYVTYSNAADLELSGFLVSVKGSLRNLVALCPLPRGYSLLREFRPEIVRQLRVALRIGSDPHSGGTFIDAIDLRSTQTKTRVIPGWIFGLSCVPLTHHWDGTLVHPQPFCPSLFTAMLAQPLAVRWMDGGRSLVNRGGSTANSDNIEFASAEGKTLTDQRFPEKPSAQEARTN